MVDLAWLTLLHDNSRQHDRMFNGGIMTGGLLTMAGWSLAICAVIAVLLWKGGRHVGWFLLRRPTDDDRARARWALDRAVRDRVGAYPLHLAPRQDLATYQWMVDGSADMLANPLLHSQDPHEVDDCDRCQRHARNVERLTKRQEFEAWCTARVAAEHELAPGFTPARGRFKPER